MPKHYFIGNWKMNKLEEEAKSFLSEFCSKFTPNSKYADTGFAPVLTVLSGIKNNFGKGSGLLLGSQNIHWLENGAHTGEVSAGMLKEQGVTFALIGHSERRQFYGETDSSVASRTKTCLSSGLTAVVCIGESKEEREKGITLKVVETQLLGAIQELTSLITPENLIIAYEPVWAIGTGLTATPEDAEVVHDYIRSKLVEILGQNIGEQISILYGGSAKAENISALVSKKNINGALVGGASLEPGSWLGLVNNGREAVSAKA